MNGRGDPFPPLSASAKARLGWEILRSYVRARWWLRKRGLPATVAMLRRQRTIQPEPLDEALQHHRGWRLAGAVNRTLGALPADSRCLVRSLVLLDLLTRRGIDTSLVIGARSGPSFEAHAWIEHAGAPILPDGGSDYGRLVEI